MNTQVNKSNTDKLYELLSWKLGGDQKHFR